MALYLKHKMEAHDGGLWHVIVGHAFGASVAHEGGSLLVLRIGGVNIMAFSSFDESTLVRKKKEFKKPAHQQQAAAEGAAAAGEEEADEGHGE